MATSRMFVVLKLAADGTANSTQRSEQRQRTTSQQKLRHDYRAARASGYAMSRGAIGLRNSACHLGHARVREVVHPRPDRLRAKRSTDASPPFGFARAAARISSSLEARRTSMMGSFPSAIPKPFFFAELLFKVCPRLRAHLADAAQLGDLLVVNRRHAPSVREVTVMPIVSIPPCGVPRGDAEGAQLARDLRLAAPATWANAPAQVAAGGCALLRHSSHVSHHRA